MWFEKVIDDWRLKLIALRETTALVPARAKRESRKAAFKNQEFFLRSRKGGNKKRSIYVNMSAFLFLS